MKFKDFKPKFDFEDIVCHIFKPKMKGVVTGMSLRQHGLTYNVTWAVGLKESWHYEYELKAYQENNINMGLKP